MPHKLFDGSSASDSLKRRGYPFKKGRVPRFTSGDPQGISGGKVSVARSGSASQPAAQGKVSLSGKGYGLAKSISATKGSKTK